jgi:hypothetical protein
VYDILNGLRAGMSAAPLMAAARVAAGVTSLTCQERSFAYRGLRASPKVAFLPAAMEPALFRGLSLLAALHQSMVLVRARTG